MATLEVGLYMALYLKPHPPQALPPKSWVFTNLELATIPISPTDNLALLDLGLTF